MRTRQSLPAWAMLGALLLLTAFASVQVRDDIETDAAKRFALACDQVTLKIRERLDAYALVLRGAAALFAASPGDVNRHQWRDYVATLRANGNDSGVDEIGFVYSIPSERLADHVAKVRREGQPDYTVWPPAERPVYAVVTYLEPLLERNIPILGFDMFSDEVRRAAMEHARDTGQMALSGKVRLLMGRGREAQPGTIMYVPVYRKGTVVSTIAQRRSALVGWVFSPYRMDELMSGILANGTRDEGMHAALKIFDGDEPTPAKLLFAGDLANTLANSRLHQLRRIDFDSAHWLLEFDGTEGELMSYASAWMTLGGGLLLSGLVFCLMLSVINTRANAKSIAATLTDEIRSREALLKESEFRWKFAIEGSGFGLWDWNLADGTVFFSNKWKEILGYSEDEMFNRFEDWERRLHSDDKADALAAVHDHLDGRTYAYSAEHRLLCKDGSYKWVYSCGLVVARSEDGKALRMIGTTMDIGERKHAENALREQKEFFHLIAENIGDFIAVLDLDGRRLYNSPSYRQFFHCGTDLLGTDSFAEVHPDDRERVRRAFRETADSGIGRQVDYRFLRADGSVRDMESVGSVIRDDTGRIARVVVVSHDVTERKQAEKALRESEAFKEIVLNSVPAEIAVLDKNGVILAVNEQWRNFAQQNGAAVGSGAAARVDVGADYMSFFRSGAESAENGVLEARNGIQAVLDGKLDSFSLDYPCHSPEQQRWFTMSVTPFGSDERMGAVVTHIDVSERKLMENQVRQMAFHDALTALPNRRLFNDRLIQSMAASTRSGIYGAVMFLDLDNFKPLNDAHGHEAGDLLLMEVASRLRACLREMDTAARFGGDEFVVMISDLGTDKVESTAQASLIAEKIRASLAEPYLLTLATEGKANQRLEHRCTVSIGVVLFINHHASHEEILKWADAAMYQAKAAGRNLIRYSSAST